MNMKLGRLLFVLVLILFLGIIVTMFIHGCCIVASFYILIWIGGLGATLDSTFQYKPPFTQTPKKKRKSVNQKLWTEEFKKQFKN